MFDSWEFNRTFVEIRDISKNIISVNSLLFAPFKENNIQSDLIHASGALQFKPIVIWLVYHGVKCHHYSRCNIVYLV